MCVCMCCVCFSDNETVRSMYRDREMSECHMEIYQVCQEGHQLVKKIELDFEEGQPYMYMHMQTM